jgi:hypothetical protein
MGAAANTAGPEGQGKGNSRGPGQRANPGGQPGSTNSGGSKKSKSSVMREATWNNMTKGARMKSHGTTSYAKYKAGKKASNVKGTSKSNRQMRGTGK